MNLPRDSQLIVETGLGGAQVTVGEGGLTDITMRPDQPRPVADPLAQFQALTAKVSSGRIITAQTGQGAGLQQGPCPGGRGGRARTGVEHQ